MRGRSATFGPLTRWVVLGLTTVLAGCSASAAPTTAPGATARAQAAVEATSSVEPTAAPVAALSPGTASPTLPPTLVQPTAEPTPQPTPPPTPDPRFDPPPRAGPFAMNLYRRGDFATQVTKIYCVPGAMQTMMNVIDAGATKASRRVQDRLYRLARRLSTDRLRGMGAEPVGWARGLEQLGYGGYQVVVANSRNAAIRAAARALRRTNRPAGLLVWRGAHAWVITGFKATADPARTERFEVTHVRIVDVWYPRVSSIWGASVKPNTLVPVDRLPEDFLPWRRPSMRYPDMDRRFILVAPVAEGAEHAIG